MDQKIKDGEVDIIYASPETLDGDPGWRSSLQKLNVTLIVVDEFHTIATWGRQSDDKMEAFRKWFSHIGELRSLFPHAVLLALSATCTLKIRKIATNSLNLYDATEITESPNKTNIKISVFKVPTSIEMAMTWIVDGLDVKKETFPKIIIYCTSIKDTLAIYKYLTTELPDCSKYIDMYHSESTATNKTDVINNLKNANSILRIVIATSALGMGIDVVNCQAVVLYGAPNTAIELIQEMGRVGRNGNPSIALLLYNSFNIRLSEVKEMYKTTNCRRHTLTQYFLKPTEREALSEEMEVHTCCDICAKRCQCGKCELLLLENMFNDSKIEDVSDDDLEKQSDSDITEPYDLDQFDYFDDGDIDL